MPSRKLGDWSGNNMKKSLLVLLIIGAVIVSLILLIYVFVLSGAFAIFMPKPPEPQITYGEFPFTITYEVDNEIVTYKDVVICEYEGIESWGTAGKRRKWSRRLKSGNEYIPLLRSEIGEASFEIYEAIPGLPEYYMGDFQKSRAEYERNMKDYRYLGYKQDDIDHTITKEDAWEKYGIRIISIDCSMPIENKFE